MSNPRPVENREVEDITEEKPALINTDGDDEVVTAAIDWAIEQSPDGSCPCCGWEPVGDKKNGLKQHLRLKHSWRIVPWYLNPTMGPDAVHTLTRREEEASVQHEGLAVGEDYNEPDMLHVPESIRSKVMERGDYFRWVSRENVRRRLDSGFRFVERPEDEKMEYQEDHSDTKMRAGDLVAMRQPRELRERWEIQQATKTREMTEGVLGRAEERDNTMSDVGRATYEAFRERNMPHENAMVLANRAEREGAPIRPRGANSISHRRR